MRRWKLSIPAFLCGVILLATASLAAPADDADQRCLALTMYWEGRADGREGMIPVGWVVLNRRNHPDFPDSICAVVRQGGETPGCQFSYWCDGQSDVPRNQEAWRAARELAAEMLVNPPQDPTGGALYFHAEYISRPWVKERRKTASLAGHIFYK